MTKQGWVKVEAWRCKGCRLCVEVCPEHALALATALNRQGYHPAELADPDACTGCAHCARMCPEAAISVYVGSREEVRQWALSQQSAVSGV